MKRTTEKILYGLGDRFDLYDLDGRDNWMRGEFDSNGATPRRRSQRLMKTLEKDPTLISRSSPVSRGCKYLESAYLRQRHVE